MRRVVVLLLGILVAAAGCDGRDGKASIEGPATGSQTALSSPTGLAHPVPAAKTAPATSPQGLPAVERAAAAGKTLFLYLHKAEDSQGLAKRKVFDAAMKSLGPRADSIAIDLRSPAEKGLIEKLELKRLPLPFVLALAPNGAVTGGFPIEFDEQKLRGALVSPAMASCLKALQDKKTVFLCVQNEQSKSHAEALAGIKAFRADPKSAATTEVVLLDPKDSAEAQTLERFKIEGEGAIALTVLLKPPGTVAARFSGPTDKAKISDAMKACTSCAGGT